MANKKQAQKFEDVNQYLVTLPGEITYISFGSDVYPVEKGRLTLTAEQAEPLLAEGFIEPVPEKPAAKNDQQPALDLPTEKGDQPE